MYLQHRAHRADMPLRSHGLRTGRTHLLYPVKIYSLSFCQSGISSQVSVLRDNLSGSACASETVLTVTDGAPFASLTSFACSQTIWLARSTCYDRRIVVRVGARCRPILTAVATHRVAGLRFALTERRFVHGYVSWKQGERWRQESS